MQEMCASLYIELFNLFSYSYVNLFRNLKFSSCGKMFTIADSEQGAYEKIFLHIDWEILKSGFNIQKKGINFTGTRSESDAEGKSCPFLRWDPDQQELTISLKYLS